MGLKSPHDISQMSKPKPVEMKGHIQHHAQGKRSGGLRPRDSRPHVLKQALAAAKRQGDFSFCFKNVFFVRGVNV